MTEPIAPSRAIAMMKNGLSIRVVDPDEDYLDIDVCACNGRFAGTTFIYAGLKELSEFANVIRGFPSNPQDSRFYNFGSRDPKIAGGFASIHFRCLDNAGHAEAKVAIEGDDLDPDRPESMILRLWFEAASLDRFVSELRSIEALKTGEALLPLV